MNFKAFHKLSYGLYIISSEWDGKKAGYVGNTVFQVTAEPPKVAISCHKDNFTTEIIKSKGAFSVSVLKQELSVSLIGEFGFLSSKDTDKFANTHFDYFSLGVPVVNRDTVAWFECRVVDQLDCGTHVLFIAEVVNSDLLSDEEPLTYDYYREKYRMLAPKNAPTYIDRSKIQELQNEVVKPETTTDISTGLQSFICSICGFTYDPEEGDPTVGIPPGTPFSDLPEDYRCPICNAGKEYFR